MDLSEAIQKLPPVCREIARRLGTQNVSEISRDMGIPRTTINDWLRQIREQFEDAGLRAYLEE
jgi:RNA polymerase sigma-70 factor (ECF subfamily)